MYSPELRWLQYEDPWLQKRRKNLSLSQVLLKRTRESKITLPTLPHKVPHSLHYSYTKGTLDYKDFSLYFTYIEKNTWKWHILLFKFSSLIKKITGATYVPVDTSRNCEGVSHATDQSSAIFDYPAQGNVTNIRMHAIVSDTSHIFSYDENVLNE